MSAIRPALTAFAALSILTGLVYPVLVTGIAQVAMPWRANGSLIREHGAIAGSELIGQSMEDPRYFWGRLSATSPVPYNAAKSGGSNFGSGNFLLCEAASRRISALRAADPSNSAMVPVDLVTASGSGLDPHISPASAELQVRRVARLRGLSEFSVRDLVERSTEAPQLGLFGESRVNVLKVNRQLDKLSR